MRRRLVAFARRYVRDADEAEDVVQEALVRARAGAGRLRSRERAEAWLFRICRHAAIDHVRSRRVRREVWRAMPEDAGEWVVPAGPPWRAPRSVDLRHLPAHQRLLVCLHYGKGLSQPMICRMSGLSPSALRVRLFRARQALGGPAPGTRRAAVKEGPTASR